jgi:hypothetical protein
VLQELGRSGLSWSRGKDADPAERVSEDERDAPIPKRPIRGRPD